jgi:hypothetical protein
MKRETKRGRSALRSLPSKAADQRLRDLAAELVEKHGIIVLLDVCQGVVNKTLVRKGIVTSAELRDAYVEDVERALARGAKAMARLAKRAKAR